jgi:5-methylcytosine-specific restriction endonuclease McrA
MAKRTTTPRPYNNGTQTESEFFGMIRSALRKTSRWWKPIAAAKHAARRAFSGTGRQKWEYQCAECKNWFKDTDCIVDHIIPCGTLTSLDDLPEFARKLFCDVSGLQVLCKPCHKDKIAEERKTWKTKTKINGTDKTSSKTTKQRRTANSSTKSSTASRGNKSRAAVCDA